MDDVVVELAVELAEVVAVPAAKAVKAGAEQIAETAGRLWRVLGGG